MSKSNLFLRTTKVSIASKFLPTIIIIADDSLYRLANFAKFYNVYKAFFRATNEPTPRSPSLITRCVYTNRRREISNRFKASERRFSRSALQEHNAKVRGPFRCIIFKRNNATRGAFNHRTKRKIPGKRSPRPGTGIT